MNEAIKFIPLTLTTFALIFISFIVKKKKRMPWLITSFVLWLMTFLYTIGVFDK